jgi:hypothetical protein
MVCGARATTEKRKNFAWYPPWVFALLPVCLLIYFIVAAILTKRMRVAMPVCRRHRSYHLWRSLAISGSFVLFGILFLVSWIVLTELNHQAGRPIDPGALALIVFIVIGGIWLTIAMILFLGSLRPVEITDRYITLTNVHERFLEELEEERAKMAEVEESPRGSPHVPQSRPAADDDRYFDPNGPDR